MMWIGSFEPSSLWISQSRSISSGAMVVASSLRQSRRIQLIFCISSGTYLPSFL